MHAANTVRAISSLASTYERFKHVRPWPAPEEHCIALYRKHTKEIREFFDGPVVVCHADVHPDDDADRVHESQCLRVSGDALHTQSLRHRLPPGAERAETQAQLQGRGPSRHHVLAALAEIPQ